MSTRSTRLRLAAGGVVLLTLAGLALAPARAGRPSLVEAIAGRYLVTLQDSVADHRRGGPPAVANLGLSGGASPALDRAVTALSNDGVAVAVAAGNEGADACQSSPARVPQVLTVAASDADDAMAGFSNGGSCVDLFAPGVRIVSTDGRSNGSVVMSGTSMSSPEVAGALALEMGTRGTTAQQAQNRVLARSSVAVTGTGRRCGLLSGCRPATPSNRLLFVG